MYSVLCRDMNDTVASHQILSRTLGSDCGLEVKGSQSCKVATKMNRPIFLGPQHENSCPILIEGRMLSKNIGFCLRLGWDSAIPHGLLTVAEGEGIYLLFSEPPGTCIYLIGLY
jgi:hypothetical protein